ncbi:MAG: hypothetical protein Q8R55_02635 [Candidatus Taylorbacteria bacterium]|nr:hypothetical protein [Candidatus Taylorbacteria bacterium]
MSDHYYFPDEQFKCMYCKINLHQDEDGRQLALPVGGDVNLECPKCGATWKFWLDIQLSHKLVKKGKYSKK